MRSQELGILGTPAVLFLKLLQAQHTKVLHRSAVATP